jgi:hypothetical protein
MNKTDTQKRKTKHRKTDCREKNIDHNNHCFNREQSQQLDLATKAQGMQQLPSVQA